MSSVLSDNDWIRIEESFNLLSLALTLVERGLLSFSDPVDKSRTTRQAFIRKIRCRKGNFVVFSSCFVVGKHYEHLGHEYVAFLLHGRGRQFGQESVLQLSSQYETVFRANMTKVVQFINVKELLPHLLEKRLLTLEEASSFGNGKGNEDIFELFRLLKGKGPTAFCLFVDCIREEKQHIGHKDLYSLVTDEGVLASPQQTKPCELSCGEALTSQEYHDRRHKFEKYYHSGQWAMCDALAQVCMESSVVEVKTIGHLELALSYVFRVSEKDVVDHVGKADVLCRELENSNRTFLSGRCKYILALLYYYLGDNVQAREYVGEAKEILFSVEVGEDKTFAAYCDAVISATNLTEKSSRYEFQEVIHKFETSLFYSSRTHDMDILVIYSFLRLGRLYLGRTETKITACKNEDRIQKSRDCQQKLTADFYSKMDDRCKGLYHLNEYDICMSTGKNSSSADVSLRKAEYFVQRSKCAMDEKAIKVRLREHYSTPQISVS